MKSFNLILREARQQRQFSQQKLAEKAGLSLATIQNIEASTGNPSLSTIQALLSALSLEIELRPQKIDFEDLVQLGVPLLTTEERPRVRMHLSFLLEKLSSFSSNLDSLNAQSREAAALAAFLCALRDHYPSVWKKVDSLQQTWLEEYPKDISPKLRRLSLQRLAEYL